MLCDMGMAAAAVASLPPPAPDYLVTALDGKVVGYTPACMADRVVRRCVLLACCRGLHVWVLRSAHAAVLVAAACCCSRHAGTACPAASASLSVSQHTCACAAVA
jgi:hypothetical protein